MRKRCPAGEPMIALADTYTQLSATLRTLLEARGFEVSEEHHHADASGAKCTLLSGGAESFRLVWDGGQSTFRVDYCPQRRDRTCPAWQTLLEAPFAPQAAATSDVRALASRIEQTLARHFESADS